MKKILSIVAALFIFGVVYAQSADVVTDMLAAPEVTFGQVCYLSAVHQGLVSDDAGFEQAIKALYDDGQIPEEVGKDAPVVMVNLAFIYSQMWKVQGGLMYRLTKGAPRYAFKQLKADGIIGEGTDPNDLVSGVEALRLYTSCAIEYGGMVLTTD